jgi:hypothetical protein
MPAKMAGSAFLPSFGVPELRPPSAPPGGLVKKRPKRKNLLSFGVHLENPGLYQVPESVTLGGFPRAGESDSRWRTLEVRYVGPDTITAGF